MHSHEIERTVNRDRYGEVIMRSFIRHPSDIPVDIQRSDSGNGADHLNNVSYGGLSLSSNIPLDAGTIIKLSISFVQPVFEAMSRVKWCKKEADHYDIGIEFLNKGDVFRARMVEQLCYIEHYKNEVCAKEHRCLTSQEAAMEWITKFAVDFPSLPDEAVGQ